jgi:hypothetical protein
VKKVIVAVLAAGASAAGLKRYALDTQCFKQERRVKPFILSFLVGFACKSICFMVVKVRQWIS